jgi:hypothetical protein
MFSVRELKDLARRLDDEAFARQLGPFVLVQRPLNVSPPNAVENRALLLPTRPLRRVPRQSVLDFEDLWVATLPPMVEHDSFFIGRAPDCDVVIDESTVSKRHARVDWSGTAATLEDLGSSNGTFVNGTRLSRPATLRDNDAVDLGGVQVFFLLVATLRRRMRGR